MSSTVTNVCKATHYFCIMLNPLVSINLGKASITDSEMLIGINCTSETLSFIVRWQCGQAVILPLPDVIYNSFRTTTGGLSGILSSPAQQDQPAGKKTFTNAFHKIQHGRLGGILCPVSSFIP